MKLLNDTETEDRFFKALASIESNNNPNAVGDMHLAHHAYGIYQIRQPAVDDVNRVFGSSYKAEDAVRPAVAAFLASRYCLLLAKWWRSHHTEELTPVLLARMWNGGYKGAERDCTLEYAEKFQKEFDKDV